MKKQKLLTREGVYQFLNKNNYMYKGKTITRRTVRTLYDNGMLLDVIVNDRVSANLFYFDDVERLLKGRK